MDEGPVKRVLCVEDDAALAAAIAQEAAPLGYEVDPAEDGARALQLITLKRYPVVIVDFRLPDTDGVRLAAEISARSPDTVFILATGEPSHRLPEPTQGFFVSLLLKPWDREQLAAALEQAFELFAEKAASNSQREIPVLLVEDSASDAYLIQQYLHAIPGVRVTHAARLAEAIELLDTRRFDTVIADLSLPDGRGLDAIGRLRERTSDATFIICTGLRDDALMLRAIQLGAQDFIAKESLDEHSIAQSIRIARERRNAERRLARMAYLDPVTGVANRAAFEERLEQALHRANRLKSRIGLVLIDLDGFKEVNDRLGHDGGDVVLKEMGKRMQLSFRSYDTVARVGGDEFGVLLTDVVDDAGVGEAASRLLDSITNAVRVGSFTASVTGSVGISFFPEHGISAQELMKRADHAMYEAKRAGKNRYCIFNGTPKAAERTAVDPDIEGAAQQDRALRVAAALRASEARYRDIAETLPHLLWTCLPDGRCDYLGPQWVSYTGIPEAIQLGYRWTDQLHADDFNRAESAWREAVFMGSVYEADFRLRRWDGAYRWFRTRAVPIRTGNSKIVRWFGSSTDIDDWQRAERELSRLKAELETRSDEQSADHMLVMKLTRQNEVLARSNRELEHFAYAASHDLQEPLRAVAGCAQILGRRYAGRLDSAGEELIRHTIEGAERMKALIQDLLNLSRVHSQGRPPAGMNSADALREAERNLDTAIRESGATIARSELPVVRADFTQLTQVFQNLLGNAIKYRGTLPPAIFVSAEQVEGGWRFSVRDNGIGIDRRHFVRIFDIFQRLHTSEDYSGTGIGLALCKKIVERHGGKIWVESEPGVGSTFHFFLPDSAEEQVS